VFPSTAALPFAVVETDAVVPSVVVEVLVPEAGAGAGTALTLYGAVPVTW